MVDCFSPDIKKDFYVSVKAIHAVECEAWKDFKGHQKGDSGYKIYYPDGYISWCPKEVFEKQYLKLESEKEVKDNDVRNYIYRSGIEKDVDFSYIKFLLKDILKWAKEGLKR
jgi:hypothetical protein